MASECKKSSISKCIIILLVMLLNVSLFSCGDSNRNGHVPFSELLIGEWHGQLDVAKILYDELGDELGIDLYPEPEYCDTSITFSEDGSCVMYIDPEGCASAVGKCAEPYVSAFFGIDTSFLVDVIMQCSIKGMSSDSYRSDGTYSIDDENYIVYINCDDGTSGSMFLDGNMNLQYEEDELNQTITFEKNELYEE